MFNNKALEKYINDYILKEYSKNDTGHGIDHIRYVMQRSVTFAKQVGNVDLDMVLTIAAYHDLGHHIDAKNHEKISAEILRNDQKLREFFTAEQIEIMAQAVEDHRASLKRKIRTIYGRIVSTADRNVDIYEVLRRTYGYRLRHNPTDTVDKMIEDSRRHLIDKFGEKGYANGKDYIDDQQYKNFLIQLRELTADKEKFRTTYLKANEITPSSYEVEEKPLQYVKKPS